VIRSKFNPTRDFGADWRETLSRLEDRIKLAFDDVAQQVTTNINTLIQTISQVNITIGGITRPAALPSMNALDGDDGLDGMPGSRGLPGLDGRPGRIGIDGDDGDDGLLGMNGRQGIDGAAGATGATGAAGPRGFTGMDGDDGEDGMHGIPGVAGAAGSAGVAGATGMRGPSGVDGDDGDEGQIGVRGMTGLPGPSTITGLGFVHATTAGVNGYVTRQGNGFSEVQDFAGLGVGTTLDANEPYETYVVIGPYTIFDGYALTVPNNTAFLVL
jgi:hypothetical protein